MRTLLWRYLFLVFIAGSVWALDQATKTWIRTHLPLGHIIPVFDGPIPFRIVHWFNRGGVFGLFQEFSWAWTVMALVITSLLVFYYPQLARQALLRWALALQLGGALGNLTDRLRLGYVTDFLSVGNFPVFNLADVFITLGIVLLLGSALFTKPEQQASSEKATPMATGDGAPWQEPTPEVPLEPSKAKSPLGLPAQEGEEPS